VAPHPSLPKAACAAHLGIRGWGKGEMKGYLLRAWPLRAGCDPGVEGGLDASAFVAPQGAQGSLQRL